MKISIIGTAGRNEDGPRMSKELYEHMLAEAQCLIRKHCNKGQLPPPEGGGLEGDL